MQLEFNRESALQLAEPEPQRDEPDQTIWVGPGAAASRPTYYAF